MLLLWGCNLWMKISFSVWPIEIIKSVIILTVLYNLLLFHENWNEWTRGGGADSGEGLFQWILQFSDAQIYIWKGCLSKMSESIEKCFQKIWSRCSTYQRATRQAQTKLWKLHMLYLVIQNKIPLAWRTLLVITALNLASNCSSKSIRNLIGVMFSHELRLSNIFPVEGFVLHCSVTWKKWSPFNAPKRGRFWIWPVTFAFTSAPITFS